MPERKLIAVVGATGAQGGGLVRAILNDPSREFHVRAITRNPDGEKAQQLVSAGAEVVAADLDKPESVKRAFDGAYGAFCITNFWEHMDPERETRQARTQAEAARSAGVQHAIWSTLEDSRKWIPLSDNRMPTLQGRYKVPHFDAKAEADAAFTSNVPSTLLFTSFYWDNFIFFGMEPRRGEDGKLAIYLPMGDRKLPGIAVDDIGKCALAIFKRGDEYRGKSVGIAGEHLTGYEMARELSASMGEEVNYVAVPPDVFRKFGFPGADDVTNMFVFNHDFVDDFCAVRNLQKTRELNPELQTFRQWLTTHKVHAAGAQAA